MMPVANELFGYGVYRLSPKQPFVGHTGEFAGYLSFAAYNPKNKVTITGFINNSDEEAKAEFAKLQEYLFGVFGN